MSNLFIIGNGFDISHGLKTSYEDFHKYLKKKYPDAKQSLSIPNYIVDGHGNDVPSCEDEVIGFIEQLLCDVDGEKWSNLESSLGKIDFENYIDDYNYNEEEDDDLWDEMYCNESSAMSLTYPILEIPLYFSQWISTINLNNIICKEDFLSLINKNFDLFLTFNYTKTLEHVYGIENVCHIHGMQGEDLLFGHGNDYDYFSEDNYGGFPGSENSFQSMHDSLKKNTKESLNKNINFFKKLGSSIDRIYSYGFSFSEVDEIYIKEICKNIDTKSIKWYFNDFDNDDNIMMFQETVKKCGFKGTFGTYNIKV